MMFKRLQQKFVSDAAETVKDQVFIHQDAIMVAGFALAAGIIIGVKVARGPGLVVVR